VVLGDVSGRGAAAASLTAEARHTIRTAAAVGGDPSAGLRLLDENLRARKDVALCSVAILVLSEPDEAVAEIDVYLAGHPHPLLVRGPLVEPLGDPGPLLGVREGARWDPFPVRLASGDQVVLYTDGVIEARIGRGERFGVERLRGALGNCEGPAFAVSRVRAALDAFGALAGDDDAALVAIRCGAGSSEAEPEVAPALTAQGE
jgi:serine phosphatase RsbU (regulator of sigma subunit)